MTKNVAVTSGNVSRSVNNGTYSPGNSASVNPPLTGGNAALGWSATLLAKGGVFTITTDGTNNFGAGPSVQVFDGYNSGTAEGSVPTNSADIGTWDRTDNSLFKDGGRDGGLCFAGWESGQSKASMEKIFDTPVTEFFLSYAVKIPVGYYFPSNQVSGANQFPDINDSCLKLAWVMLGNTGSDGVNDLCLPTHSSPPGAFNFYGNDSNYWTYPGNNPAEWWKWDKWMRLNIWLKADAANPSTVSGTGYFSIANSVNNLYEYNKTDAPLFDVDKMGAENYEWDRIKMLPWARGGSPGSELILIDDVYMSSGPNSAARVEIGNNANYALCTDLAILPTTAWSTNSITCNFERGGIDINAGSYLFITSADNTTRVSVQVM